MSGDLGLALLIYIITVLYIHNNSKELLVKYSNILPVLALGAYYVATALSVGVGVGA
jgi:hypothetical protein